MSHCQHLMVLPTPSGIANNCWRRQHLLESQVIWRSIYSPHSSHKKSSSSQVYYTCATDYEPGEQLTATAKYTARRYRCLKFIRRNSTVNKSLWKNPSPTQSRSSMRATTIPGLRLSSLILMIKICGK